MCAAPEPQRPCALIRSSLKENLPKLLIKVSEILQLIQKQSTWSLFVHPRKIKMCFQFKKKACVFVCSGERQYEAVN